MGYSLSLFELMFRGWRKKGIHTAIEPVVIRTPPSGFFSNVGLAAFRSACGTLTLAAQHCDYKLGVKGTEASVSGES